MSQPHLNILMADDDEEDMELMGDAITTIEPAASLHKVTNGRAVIDFLSRQQESSLPCLIVLDYNMPEMNGSEVLQVICRDKRYEKIPKVILSTSSTPVHIHECLEQGASEYFVKPNSMQGLNDLARKMIAICGLDAA